MRFYGQPQARQTPVVTRVWHDFGAGRGAALERLASSPEFQTGLASRLALLAMLLLALVSRATDQTDVTIAIPRA